MRAGLTALWSARKAIDDGLRVGGVVGGDRDLDAVAGGEDHGFGDALARPEVGQRGGQRLLAEGQALPHFDGRRLVAHACDQQLHCLKQEIPQPGVGGPGDRGEADHGDGHDGGFAPAPPGGDPQADQRQVDAPGEERDRDLRLADPVGSSIR